MASERRLGPRACLWLALLGLAGAAAPKGALAPPVAFQNSGSRWGIGFVHNNHPTPQKYMIESVPGGIAAFDYNGDGWADVYFTNGATVPALEKSGGQYSNRLYRNERGERFSDVTGEAGVGGSGYSMGAAAGDYDNDGHIDLFVAGVNQNILFRNLGNGKFADVTGIAGIKSDAWSVAGGWFDYDNDGLLDLFVVNYLKWSPSLERFCGKPEIGLRTYCSPTYFDGRPNSLYRNLGDGKFEDVSIPSGIARHIGKGMSVAFADFDADGHMDAVVPNDTEPNFLFRNKGDGTFNEVGLISGVALDDAGKVISSMGVDFRDYDNDGRPDINITALTRQTFPLFRNVGAQGFVEAGHASGLSRLTVGLSGWCNGFVDLNNDGNKDLFTANSHVNDVVERLESTSYKQANSVFVNLGEGRFADASTKAGTEFQRPRAHRGCAFADFNRDGRIDVAVSVLGEKAEIWENVSPGREHWIVVKPVGKKSNRDGIGARLRIGSQSNHMTTAVGYASSSHYGVHFGLGALKEIDVLTIEWPAGKSQTLKAVAVDRVLEIVEEP